MRGRRVMRTVTAIEVSPTNNRFGNPTWFKYHFDCGHVQRTLRITQARIAVFLLSQKLTTRRKCWECSK